MEYTEAFNDLSSVLSSLDSDQIQKFLTEILTEGELKDITLRWKYMQVMVLSLY